MRAHSCADHFEHGSVEKDSAETVKWVGYCTVCGRKLVEVYDYRGTYAPDADAFVRRRSSGQDHDGTVPVYAVVVHPSATTSYLANVYADRAEAEQVRDELRSERQGIDVDIEEYGVDA